MLQRGVRTSDGHNCGLFMAKSADFFVATDIRSASAVIDLGHPRSNPRGPSTTLFLEVEEDEDLVEYVWSFGISEEEAGFGEAEFGSGWSPDLQQAEDDCWEAVVIFLRGEG